MYATGPPVATSRRLRIRAVARRTFEAPPAIAGRPEHRPHLHEYLSDLVKPYGLSLQDDLAGHSYGEMAATLIGELVPADQPVELLVVAFAIPDVRPGRATATYLSHLCPGQPLAFAVCDQGSAAAFTGLRLIRDYTRSGGCRRALLLVLEQAGLPYDAGLPVDVPAAPTAVGLLCDGDGDSDAPARVESIRQYAGVAPDEVAALLPGTGQVIANDELPAGRPHTAVWWELADALQRPGRVTLAAHDPHLRYLCLTTIEVAPRTTAA
jgi:4-hydroxymandelate oxidase